MIRILAVWLVLFGLCPTARLTCGQDPIFSGPQVGEGLPPFSVRIVQGEKVGESVDLVTRWQGKPSILIFNHDINRQSISLTRAVSNYAQQLTKQGLASAVVFLRDDATEAEQTFHRIKHALSGATTTAVSIDGREGPGALGLNRNVMLTILIAKENKIVANYTLVQPSLQVDLPRIAGSMADLFGVPKPKLEDLLSQENAAGAMRMEGKEGESSAPNMRPLLIPVIQKNASDEQVEQAAKVAEEKAAQDPAIAKELGRIANTIVHSGKLENYGTAKAQEILTRWAKQYGPEKKASDRSDVKPNGSEADKPK